MDACAIVVGLLVEVVQVAWQAGQEVARRRQPAEELAEGAYGGPVFGRLKDQAGRRGGAFAFAAGPTVAEDRGGYMRAVTAVDILGAVVADAGEAARGNARLLRLPGRRW